MSQHRNNLNHINDQMNIKEVVERLVKAKRCWDEAVVASEMAQSSNQINAARQSLERLRATIENLPKKLGWNWEELGERAERMLGKSDGGGGLAHRLTAEGSLNMDTEDM